MVADSHYSRLRGNGLLSFGWTLFIPVISDWKSLEDDLARGKHSVPEPVGGGACLWFAAFWVVFTAIFLSRMQAPWKQTLLLLLHLEIFRTHASHGVQVSGLRWKSNHTWVLGRPGCLDDRHTVVWSFKPQPPHEPQERIRQNQDQRVHSCWCRIRNNCRKMVDRL